MRGLFVLTGLITALILILPIQGFAQDDNVINACVGRSGRIRIVDSSDGCRPWETSLSWNIQGPQGPEGAPGSEGPPGEAGIDGISCWDLDGNGICDLSTEDKNGDTRCDALDCQYCGIQAYDANGDLLGTLLGMDHEIISGPPVQSTHSDLVYIPTLAKFFRFNKEGTNVYELEQIWTYTGNFTEYDPDLYPYPDDTQWALCCGHVFGIQHFIVTFQFTESDIGHFCGEYHPASGSFMLTRVELPFDYPVARPIRIE